MRGTMPGEFEQIVLLTLAAFRDASGRQVYEAILDTTGRETSVAAVHITLDRLTEKGWAACEVRAPEPGRGGKPRKRYALTPEGARVLADLRQQLDRLWKGARAHPYLAP